MLGFGCRRRRVVGTLLFFVAVTVASSTFCRWCHAAAFKPCFGPRRNAPVPTSECHACNQEAPALTCCPDLEQGVAAALYDIRVPPQWLDTHTARPMAATCINAIARLSACIFCAPQLIDEHSIRWVPVDECALLVAACDPLPRDPSHAWGRIGDPTPVSCARIIDSVLRHAADDAPEVLVWPPSAADLATLAARGQPVPSEPWRHFGPKQPPARCLRRPSSSTADKVFAIIEANPQRWTSLLMPKADRHQDVEPMTGPHACDACAVMVDGVAPDHSSKLVDLCDLKPATIEYTQSGLGSFSYELRPFPSSDRQDSRFTDHRCNAADPGDGLMCYCTPEFGDKCGIVATRESLRATFRTSTDKDFEGPSVKLEFTAPGCFDDPSRPWHTVLDVVCEEVGGPARSDQPDIGMKNTANEDPDTIISLSEIGGDEQHLEMACGDVNNDFCERCFRLALPEARCHGYVRKLLQWSATGSDSTEPNGTEGAKDKQGQEGDDMPLAKPERGQPMQLLASVDPDDKRRSSSSSNSKRSGRVNKVPVGSGSMTVLGGRLNPLRITTAMPRLDLWLRADTCMVNVEQATVQVVSSTMTALPASEGHDATLWKRDTRIVDVAARTGTSIFTATPQDAPMNATIGYIAARPRTGYDGTRRFHLSLRCLQRGVVRVAASVMVGKKVVETVHIEGACEKSDYVLMRRGTMFQAGAVTSAGLVAAGAILAGALFLGWDRWCRGRRRDWEPHSPMGSGASEASHGGPLEIAVARDSSVRSRRRGSKSEEGCTVDSPAAV